METFGLGYEDCKRIRPDILDIGMSMQGSLGPQRDFRGTGSSIAALTGIQDLSGLPGNVPAGTGTNYPDHLPNPCHAAFALLAALRHRRRTGQGQCIDFAQTEPMLSLMGPTFLDLTVNGRLQQRRGNDHPWMAPHGVYPCVGSDRWIAITVATDVQWAALVGVWVLHRWPLEGWMVGRVKRVCRRVGFSHVVGYASSSPLGAVVVDTLLDAASSGSGCRLEPLAVAGRPTGCPYMASGWSVTCACATRGFPLVGRP
jgi:crotonobetainyl-CoA:carnitine CoA-transferase CaiB-like acyl-CoA transferase